jgi:hypothetical protein
VRVTARRGNTTLARIIHAVEQAQATRAPTQRFVDRFAAVYTPAVFVLALAVALLGPWLLGWTWLQALYKALVLLVIACPCALVISTPVTVVSGLAAAARRGILIKGGIHLEERAQAEGRRARQDRHDHRGQAAAGGLEVLDRRRRRCRGRAHGRGSWPALRPPGLARHCRGPATRAT